MKYMSKGLRGKKTNPIWNAMSTSALQGSIQYPVEVLNAAPGILLYMASQISLETYLNDESLSSAP